VLCAVCCGCRPAMHIFKLLDFNNGFRSVGPATGLMVLRTLSGSSGSPGKICRYPRFNEVAFEMAGMAGGSVRKFGITCRL